MEAIVRANAYHTIKPEAAAFLDQWAFLHPRDVSYELIQTSLQASGSSENAAEAIEGIAGDELSFHDSLGVLEQYSLFDGTAGRSSFSIHPAVHDWSLHSVIDQEGRELLCARAIQVVAKRVPLIDEADRFMVARVGDFSRTPGRQRADR